MSESQSGETGETNTNTACGRRAFCVGAVGTLALAGTGVASAGVEGLAYGSDYVANVAIAGDVTVAEVRSDMDLLEYRDDNGDATDLRAELDEPDAEAIDSDATVQNLLELSADRIDASEYRRFPVDMTRENADEEEEAITSIDAGEWTGSSGMTVEEGSLDIDSVRMTATPADGSTETATFDPSELIVEDDIERRYLQVGVTVDALESGSVVEFRVQDDSGNSKVVTIDPSGDESADDVLATAIDSGIIRQVQLGDLTGTLNEIASVEVAISDAEADLSLFALNAERMSRWEFGTRYASADADSPDTVREPTGETSYSGLSGVASDSVVYDLTYPVRYTAELSEEGGFYESEPAEKYPNFDQRLTQLDRIRVPTGYDLSHSSLTLELEQTLPTDRYHGVEIAEDTADTDDAEDMDFSSASGSLSGEGTTATLEEFPQTGLEYAIRIKTVLTDGEYDTATSPAAGGGAGAVGQSSGWLSGPRAWLTVIVSGILGALGLSRLGGE